MTVEPLGLTSQGREPGAPLGSGRKSRTWSLRSTLNLVLGVTGAFWALVALVLHLLF